MERYAASVGEPVESLTKGKTGKALATIKEMSNHEDAYIVYNLKEHRVTWHHNFGKYFGYDWHVDDNFSIEFYTNAMHRFIRQWQTTLLGGIYLSRLEKRYSKSVFMKTRYVVTVPIMKKDGNFVLVKQTSMPFQYDKNGIEVSHLISHLIINEYHGEALNPKIYHDNSRLHEDENKFLECVLEFLNITSKHSLSPALWNVVDEILKLPMVHNNHVPKMLGNSLKKIRDSSSLSSTGTAQYILRIKEKLLPLFDIPSIHPYSTEEDKILAKWLPDFQNAYTLVKFCHESRILDILRLLDSSNHNTKAD